MSATNDVLQEGRYQIKHQFPISDDGAVFDAYDTVRDTKVLVKEIVVRMNRVTTASQQHELQTAFANQAKVLTSIKHETLINIHDFFSEIGRQYLVMEALEGNELSDLIAREGRAFAVETVVRWADQLLDGLHYLHTFEPSIVHKNIRPDNIKLTSDNRVKLLAFGLADGSDTRISTSVAGSREESEISYLPLEQVWDSLDSASQRVIADSYGEQEERMLLLPLDATTDIYSLGATLYHLLTGNKPVSALERSIELLDGNADPLPVPSKVNPAIPESISMLVMKAMQVKRSERFSSSAEMRERLRSVFPLNDLARSVNAVKASSDQTITHTEKTPEQNDLANPSVANLVAPDLRTPQTVVEPVSPAAVEDFSSVLTVDHDGGDGTARYDVETATPVIVERPATTHEEIETEPFTYGSERNSSSVPMAAIAGGIALLIMVAVGAWYAMSSGSSTNGASPATQTQSTAPPSDPVPAASQPAPTQEAIVPVAEVSPEVVTQSEAAPVDEAGTTRNTAIQTPAKSAKPPAPSKVPTKKKALTVDDLIRDN